MRPNAGLVLSFVVVRWCKPQEVGFRLSQDYPAIKKLISSPELEAGDVREFKISLTEVPEGLFIALPRSWLKLQLAPRVLQEVTFALGLRPNGGAVEAELTLGVSGDGQVYLFLEARGECLPAS